MERLGGASGSGKMQGEHSVNFYCQHLCLAANAIRLYDHVWKMKNVEILVFNKNWSKLT